MKKLLLLLISVCSLFTFAGCQKDLNSDEVNLVTVTVSPMSMTLITGQSKEITVSAETNSGVKVDLTSECNFSILELAGSKNVIKLKDNKVTGVLPGAAKVKVEYQNLPVGYPTIVVE